MFCEVSLTQNRQFRNCNIFINEFDWLSFLAYSYFCGLVQAVADRIT